MIIGVPKEIKTEEKRVALTPSGANAFVAAGHTVLVEKNAGVGSGIQDSDYEKYGAKIVDAASDAWGAEMVIKVKEPLPSEYQFLRKDLILYTYLHLAAARELTDELIKSGTCGIAYETIQLPDGSLPLLAPMSEVAGRLSIQMGAYCLEAHHGGSGILLSGVSGVKPADVVIIGAGVSGQNACHVAAGMDANVTILDIDPGKLKYVADVMRGRVSTLYSNAANIEEAVLDADLVIGSVLVPGAKAPHLVSEDLVKRMKKGSAIVDIAVDQGGCVETTKATTHADPTYILHDIVHYAVANMPGAVPRTSTFALTNATLSFGLEIANKGWEKSCTDNQAIKLGVNTTGGKIICRGVADAFNYECTLLEF